MELFFIKLNFGVKRQFLIKAYTPFFILVSGRCDQVSHGWLCKFYFFHQICVSCKSNINCHGCHSDSESSSSIHVQISQSYVAKCKFISRTHRFLNLTVPVLKIIGVCHRSIRPNIIPVPCRALLQRSLGVRN
jgi:hypothetical protein